MSETKAAGEQSAGFGRIDVGSFAKEREGVRLIDVREPDEFKGELGHVRGAELVPLATVEAAASSWPKNERLVIVCRSGKRSAKAAELLARMGFDRVENLEGGMLAWNEAKLPIER